MTICKGKRYIKATCDKCVELPYCKPTEKTRFKKAQQVYNKFLFDSHIKTLREVELQEKRIATVELNAKVARGDFLTLEERVDTVQEQVTRNSIAIGDCANEHKMLIRLLPSRVREIMGVTPMAIYEQPRATHNARLEKLESLVGTLQQHSEDIFNLGKDVKEHHAKIYRLETHIDVMESNARVATECSNKQAYAIEALQKEIHFIKERLAQCQDSVAELDPLGCVIVRKRGRPRKSS